MRRLLLLLFVLVTVPSARAQTPRYLDPAAPVDARVEDLLGRMTLEEKIGQMTQINYQVLNRAGDYSSNAVELVPEKARQIIRDYHIGSFLNGIAIPAAEWLTYGQELQRINLEESRLKIPIIYGMDHVHGTNYITGGTVFPQQINLGATFDTTFATQMGAVTARESAFLGHHWNFAPILDLGRNARWPRLYETYGESYEVASKMGAAYVRALQAERVGPHRMAATLKHYLGYSDPRSGWDRTPADIPAQALYEFFVPSFKAAIDAGAMTVMINSGEINGEPVHASHRYLTELLRDELGFEGFAVTDWEDIQRLVNMHHAAETEKEATKMAVDAGIDMSMVPMSVSFAQLLKELVDEGQITEARLDESVRRILRIKFMLGLFEHPMPSAEFLPNVGAAAHRQAALEAARASLVLLRNTGGVLPLKAGTRVLLAGPTANSKRNLSGGWSLEWQGAAEERYPADMKTIYDALREALPGGTVSLARESPERFMQQALNADVIVLALGEEPYTEGDGNFYDLMLPEAQRVLIRTAAALGKPVVGVFVGGRPRPFPDELPLLDAFVWAGLPGFEGGQAIADVLTGAANPSGRLPIVYPATTSHVVPYNHKPSEHAVTPRWVSFDFGEGLSYTTFAYENLTLSRPAVAAGQGLTASVTVRNTGTRPGAEAVLWFLTDEVGRITRPVRELKHFERITLQPGEARTVTFPIEAAALQYPDAQGRPVTEPGWFTLRVGDQTTRFRLQ